MRWARGPHLPLELLRRLAQAVPFLGSHPWLPEQPPQPPTASTTPSPTWGSSRWTEPEEACTTAQTSIGTSTSASMTSGTGKQDTIFYIEIFSFKFYSRLIMILYHFSYREGSAVYTPSSALSMSPPSSSILGGGHRPGGLASPMDSYTLESPSLPCTPFSVDTSTSPQGTTQDLQEFLQVS